MKLSQTVQCLDPVSVGYLLNTSDPHYRQFNLLISLLRNFFLDQLHVNRTNVIEIYYKTEVISLFVTLSFCEKGNNMRRV